MQTTLVAYTAKKISPMLAAADMEEPSPFIAMFSDSKSRGSLRNIRLWNATARPSTS
jgi:hypothetical protein